MMYGEWIYSQESLLHVQEWTTLATDSGRRTSEGLWGRVRHFVSQSPSQQAHGKVPMGLPGLLLLTLELLTRSTRNPFLISLFHVSLSVPRSSNNCKSNLRVTPVHESTINNNSIMNNSIIIIVNLYALNDVRRMNVLTRIVTPCPRMDYFSHWMAHPTQMAAL